MLRANLVFLIPTLAWANPDSEKLSAQASFLPPETADWIIHTVRAVGAPAKLNFDVTNISREDI